MPVYTRNGTPTNTCYARGGSRLAQAYDKAGRPLLSTEGGTSLVVMSYNVGQWYYGTGSMMPQDAYPTYSALQRTIMQAQLPDIMAVQEYYDPVYTGHTVEEMIGEFFDYHHAMANSSYKTKALWTKGLPMSDYEAINFSNDSAWNYQRARVTIGGKDVWILNTHLITSFSMQDPTRERKKVEQAAEIFRVVSALDSFILFGDFNVICKDTSHVEYITMMKQFVDAGFNMANCSPRSGFIKTCSETTDMADGEPCDNIITSADITIDDVWLDEHKIAVTEATGNRLDHFPICARITVY